MPRKNAPELQSLQSELKSSSGRDFWRSLEEWSNREEFQQYLKREFAEGADQWGQGSRREFLKLMGASLALAGLVGCGEERPESIVPYVTQPEEIVPGRPLYFATAMMQNGFATGLLVESHMGRPTKIEGNPKHPSVPAVYWKGDDQAAPGVSDIFTQAAILNLYDPDRSQTVSNAGRISTWSTFLTALRSKLEIQKSAKGRGIRLLTETITSPTLAQQIADFRETYPEAKWHQFEPFHRDNELAGARLAFGEFVSPHYDLNRAEVIVSLDADFLVNGPNHLNHAIQFANQRDVQVEGNKLGGMNRLYVLESTPTLTGAKADHRLPLSARQIEDFAIALAMQLGVELGDTPEPALSPTAQKWLEVIVPDLQRERAEDKSSLILAGPSVSPAVHALAHAMNQALGNVGKTVSYSAPIEAEPVLEYESLRELVEDMEAGEVDVLCILCANPVYSAPADLNFAGALEKVPFRVHLGLYEDETAVLCDWHIPEAHFLESWGDARAADGTVSIMQPLIAPLYQGRSQHEMLAALQGKTVRSPRDIVQEYWRSQPEAEEDFDTLWQTTLHEGVMANTQVEMKSVALAGDMGANVSAAISERPPAAATETVDVVFRPDPSVGDGRFANNAWLQELPKPFTKLTWDNAALISPQMAEARQLQTGDVIELDHEGRSILAPVCVVPGHPEQSVTIFAGYGRTRAGRVGTGAGFDAYQLQRSQTPWHLAGVRMNKTGEMYDLAFTQHHHVMEGRDLVRLGRLDEWQKHPEDPPFMHVHHLHGPVTSFFPADEHRYDGYKWAMTIDLNRCIGCNACMVACQSENNIPVVGKDQVATGREMHWIRVDTYYEGEPANPVTVHQPVTCMHCENAPCELVCPVAATVHGDEGLNEMVYNRCVGTRYCSNNCPYKVRRFNYLQYSETEIPVLKLLQNPDVTVRNRGVMEKCTYCTQRISAARIEAEKRESPIRDGELVTACQAACPTQAILFGDLNAADSLVNEHTKNPRNYALLGELNTRPRTTYLAAVRNPNSDLEPPEQEAHG